MKARHIKGTFVVRTINCWTRKSTSHFMQWQQHETYCQFIPHNIISTDDSVAEDEKSLGLLQPEGFARFATIAIVHKQWLHGQPSCQGNFDGLTATRKFEFLICVWLWQNCSDSGRHSQATSNQVTCSNGFTRIRRNNCWQKNHPQW